MNINEKFNQFNQIIQQQLTESNKQQEAKLKEAAEREQKLRDKLEEDQPQEMHESSFSAK